MPRLVIQGINFSFRQDSVLRDVNFRVEHGEFVALLGASGCGKSTLLRLLAGLLQPTRGSISNAADQANADGTGSTASFVFQKPTLCPWLTVLQNVELPLRLRGVARAERLQVCHDAIRLVGLSEQDCRKMPRQLSGGMRMRVSLARAFVTKPQLMLMDEPFSALDEVLRQQLTETCLDLWQRESWTTVFVTHNVAEAVFLSQRIHILAGKPATIVDTIEIPFLERDRKLRTSAEFIRLVAEVSERLRQAVEQGTLESAL